MFKKLRADIAAAKENDPAARSKFEIWLTYSGVHALSWHRWANFLYRHHLKLLARITSQLARRLTGIEIHPAAKIAPGVFIDHGMGVVIGETAEVGKGTVIYQGVTLGGTGKESGKRHPTVGEYCVISSGVKVLGNIYIGDYAKIGAGAVVLKDVPPHATVVGVPGKVVRIRGSKEGLDLLQETSDPVTAEVCKLRERSFSLEAQVQALTKELQAVKARPRGAAPDEDLKDIAMGIAEENEELRRMHAEDSARLSRLEQTVSALAQEKAQQDSVSKEQQAMIQRLSEENASLASQLNAAKQALAEMESEDGAACPAPADIVAAEPAEPADVPVPVANTDGSVMVSVQDLMAENEALRRELAEIYERKAARQARRDARRAARMEAQAQETETVPADSDGDETAPAAEEQAEPAEAPAEAPADVSADVPAEQEAEAEE